MTSTQHPFDLLMGLETDFIRLDCAALHLARDVYPYADLISYTQQLDTLAAEVAEQRPGLSSTARYEALQEVLVGRHGFTGNDNDFYDPDNSYLNRVLDLGVGIPISLSVIWLEVGRRLKWSISGIDFPRHFLVRIDDHERFVVVDPFNDGASLSLKDCEKLLKDSRGALEAKSRERLRPEHLAACDTRRVLARLLGNLRTIYMVNNDWPRLEKVLRRLAAVEPANGHHLTELAALHARQGDAKRAYAHLAAYLARVPENDESTVVRQNLQRLEAAIAMLN